MAIKIVGPIKEITENEDRIGWISPEMDAFKGEIFQKGYFEKTKPWRINIDVYTPNPKSGSFTFTFARRWVLDTEDIRSDWFKHE